jgi:5'-3' exonuclease
MARYAVIDLANMFYRAQHVTQGDAYTKAGMALHIMFRSMRKLFRDFRADHMVFCIEGRSWRYQVFPQYKAKRRVERLSKSQREKEEDEVMMEVLNQTIEYLAEKTRCTVLQSDGVEGDDFVARWIQLHPNDHHIILSGDSDFIQLLDYDVTIVDGVNERVITRDAVTDFTGQKMQFSVDPSKGKLKVGGPADVEFVPEEEWWKKALFIKIIRGDASDSIFSAYPGVRYEGSSKKTGIREAWGDRKGGGFHWNNFMLQRWSKLMGKDADGNDITQDVRVLDEFKFNESLIDLTKQPDHIKDLMDEVIVQAVQKEPVSGLGPAFLKFCRDYMLVNLAKEANDHCAYLSKPYGG